MSTPQLPTCLLNDSQRDLSLRRADKLLRPGHHHRRAQKPPEAAGEGGSPPSARAPEKEKFLYTPPPLSTKQPSYSSAASWSPPAWCRAQRTGPPLESPGPPAAIPARHGLIKVNGAGQKRSPAHRDTVGRRGGTVPTAESPQRRQLRMRRSATSPLS